MTIHHLPLEGLPDEVQETLRAYLPEMMQSLGDRVEGIILYGSAVRGDFLPGRSNLNLLLLLSSYDGAVLKTYGALHTRWSKEQIVVPLLLTEADIVASSKVFPLEYLEIHDHHRLLGGRDPFIGFHVDQRYLGVEVMQGLAGNLLRTRQRYVEGGGTEEAATILLPLSITALLPCLRGLQRLLNRPVLHQSDALIKDVSVHLSIDLQGLHDALLLKRGQISPGPKEVPRFFDRYVDSLSQLVTKAETVLGQGTP